jgi:hypothetical protein
LNRLIVNHTLTWEKINVNWHLLQQFIWFVPIKAAFDKSKCNPSFLPFEATEKVTTMMSDRSIGSMSENEDSTTTMLTRSSSQCIRTICDKGENCKENYCCWDHWKFNCSICTLNSWSKLHQ